MAKKSSSTKKTTSSTKKSTATNSKNIPSVEKESTPVVTSVTSSPTASQKPVSQVQQPFWIKGVVIGALVLVGIGFLFKEKFVVAWVNGEPVYTSEYISEMENQVGQQTLDGLIMKTLVMQKAQEQGVSIDQAVVDAELQQIESQISQQGQTLDALLEQQGMTRADLIEDIRVQKLVEELVPADASASADDIAEYLERNEDFFPEDLSQEEREEMAQDAISSQNKQGSIQEWLEALKVQADIVLWQ